MIFAKLLPFLVTILSLVITASSVEAKPFSAVTPIHPAALLQAMPKTLPNWKCKFSRGQNLISGSGIPVTQAIRRYEITIEDTSVSPPVPKTVQCQILLMDIGSKAEDAEDFKSRLMLPASGTSSHKRLDADEKTLGVYNISKSGSIMFDGICGDRLILEMEILGASEKEFLALFKSADFSALASLSGSLPEKKTTSRIFTLHIADELNPKLNRSYQAGTADSEEGPYNIPPPLAQ
jgi:hypothetical protein